VVKLVKVERLSIKRVEEDGEQCLNVQGRDGRPRVTTFTPHPNPLRGWTQQEKEWNAISA
jgi:hypothetical protein